MRLTMKADVPEGEYLGKLLAVEEWKENADKYGPAIRFVWEITRGDFQNQEVTRITGTRVTKKTALGKLLRGLKGGAIEPGEEIDPTQFIGREYLLTVAETDSGSTRVESAISPPVA